jgi:hypothetical protein
MVDLVLEVRDARIPLSTCHPQVGWGPVYQRDTLLGPVGAGWGWACDQVVASQCEPV